MKSKRSLEYSVLRKRGFKSFAGALSLVIAFASISYGQLRGQRVAKTSVIESTQAVRIASWNIESQGVTGNTGSSPTITSPTADTGAQTAASVISAFHASNASVWSAAAGNGSPAALNGNGWAIGDYFQFQFNTTGYSGIRIDWDQTGSNTGPKDFKVQYSTDGATFIDAGVAGSTYSITNDAWSSAGSRNATSTRTVDLSSIAALNNKPAVYIRLVNTTTVAISSANPVAATGSGRVDNFRVSDGIATAASVSVSGRVSTRDGRGVTNAAVMISGDAMAQPRAVYTGRNGMFSFEGIEAGHTYVITVGSQRFTFSNSSMVIAVSDNVSSANFTSDQ